MDNFSSLLILEHQIKLWCNKEIVLQKIKQSCIICIIIYIWINNSQKLWMNKFYTIFIVNLLYSKFVMCIARWASPFFLFCCLRTKIKSCFQIVNCLGWSFLFTLALAIVAIVFEFRITKILNWCDHIWMWIIY